MVDKASALPRRSFMTARLAAFLGIIAVAAILGGIAVLTADNLHKTSDGLDRLSRSIQLGDAYSQTTIAIGLARVYSDAYQRTGDPVYRQLMVDQIVEALRYEELAKQLATEEDRATIREIDERYSAELRQAMLVLQGQDFGEDNNPLILDDIVAFFARPSAQARERAASELISLDSGFDQRTQAVVAAFLLAIPVLGLLFYLITRYERQDAIRAAELHKLGQAVLTDGLTGLRNHRAFQEDLRTAVARASRTEAPISVAMVDIDHFKEINDSMGHARGDTVLSQVGKLMSFLRSEDSAYRIGGDEFAVILPDTNVEGAHTAMERLRQSITSALKGVTISAGVSSSETSVNAQQLRDHADAALYEAKRAGKDQVAVYSDELYPGSELTAGKMTALREMLRQQSIVMWFQPIFRIDSKELLAFEALLRMPDTPEFEGPEDAFDTAQRMGLSHDLDMMCTRAALDAAGQLEPHMRLFINLDPATLIHADFSANELLALVQERGIDPARVVFEVTEKTSAPLPRLVRQVDALHACGFGVALDDVGAGNSGLEMLRLIKFDYVKIDRSVVLDAMNGGAGRAVILAIVAFARETGAFMIAEGIEDRGMLSGIKLDEDGLQRFWIQGVQGFLFGEPRPSMEEYSGRTAA